MQRRVVHWVSVCVYIVACVVGGEEQQATMSQDLLQEVRLALSAQGKMLRDIRYRTLQGKTQVARLEAEVRKLTSGNGNSDGGSCNPEEDPSCEPFRARSMDTLKETQQGLSLIYDSDSGGMADLLHRLESNFNRLSQLVEYMTAETTPTGPSDSPASTSPPPSGSTASQKNITVEPGQSVLLSCPLENPPQGGYITWIRNKDLQILSVGTSIYASDQRFAVVHPEDSSDWQLRIDSVNENDAGGYECLVSAPHQAGASGALDAHVVWLSIVAADQTLRPVLQPNINQNVTVYVGDTVRLDCRISNLGNSVVLWKKGKRVLTVGALNVIQDSRVRLVNKFGSDNWQLKIQSVKIRDDGVYDCHVSSFLDLPDAPRNRIIFYLEVLDRPTESPPTVRTYLRQDVSVDEGDTAILICTADNLGASSVSWIRSSDSSLLTVDTNRYTTDDRYSAVHKPGSDDWQLEIRRVAPKDSDVYRCEISRPEAEGPAIRHEISLTVDKRPDYPTIQADYRQNVTVKEGDTAILSCRIRNLGNSSVAWIRMRDLHIMTVGRYTYTTDDRVSASHKPGSNDWELRIAHVVRRDSGTYACQISKKGPDGVLIEHGFNLYVEETAITAIHPELSPNVTVYKGEAAELNCRVSDLGVRTVSWIRKKDSHVISSNRRLFVADRRFRLPQQTDPEDYQLRILDVDYEDSGIYTCEVSAYNEDGNKLRHDVWLNVERPPLEYIQPESSPNVTVHKGDTALLNCRIRNVGLDNEISWRYGPVEGLLTIGNTNVIRDGRVTFLHEEGSEDWQLQIAHVTQRDAGQYFCQVNSTTPEEHSIWLIVEEEPRSPAIKTEFSPNVDVSLGETAVLNCRISNIGSSKMAWIYMPTKTILSVSETKISRNRRISILHEEGSEDWKLQIAHVTQRDAGQYLCQVNLPEMIEHSVWLTVQDSRLPIILEEESSQNVSFTEGEKVTLTCRVHNLGDHSVTWTRSHDQQSLAVGAYRLTTDERIQPKYVSETMDWVLEISSIRKEDAGEYECQVSTDPVTSLTVSMAVEDAPTTTVMPATTRSCPTPFHLEDANLCVLVITKLRLSWNDASNYCRNQSGELAQFSPGSYLQDYLNIQHGLTGDSWNRWPFWVGGLEEGEAEGEISWKWQDGSNVDPAIWAPSHPMSYGRSKTPEGACMILDGYHSYMAASLPCHLKRRFVCIYK